VLIYCAGVNVNGVGLCYLNNLSKPHTSDCHSLRTQLVHKRLIGNAPTEATPNSDTCLISSPSELSLLSGTPVEEYRWHT
jgi:hypothetical protein